MHLRRVVGHVDEHAWETARRERVRQRKSSIFPPCDGDPACQQLCDWVTHSATVVCLTCGSMAPQELKPADMKRASATSVQSCSSCTQHTYVVPHPDLVPCVLKGLSAECVFALRPCCLHQGTVQSTSQYGYKYSSEISAISWDEQSVQDKIAGLPTELRQRTTAALRYLEGSPHSTVYKAWLRNHEIWLRRLRNSTVSRETRFLPKTDLFKPALECVLWPHLYFRDDWADQPKNSESDSESEDGEVNVRWSSKRSFSMKVLSPVLDYSLDFSLATFVYDRWFLKTFTGAGNTSGITLHRALAEKSLGNAWLQRLKHAMCDLHRQHGWADYFMTLAPFELYTPMTEILEHAMFTSGTHVRSLPALVLYQVLHSALEVIKRYLLGSSDRIWKTHAFSDKSQPQNENIIAWALRQELQSGKRLNGDFRRPVEGKRLQHYHSRQGVHWHIGLWVRSRSCVHFGHMVRADCGGTVRQKAYVPKIQKSGQPLYAVANPDPTQMQIVNGKEKTQFHYPAVAHGLGIRPFEQRSSSALLCHMDVQEVNTSSAVVNYMTKMTAYVTKDSTQHNDVLLQRNGRYLQQARLYLKHKRPVESEMWATLLGFRQKLLSHAVKHIDPPDFKSVARDLVYKKFLESPLREEYPYFLLWLRNVRHTLLEPRPYMVKHTVAVAMNFCGVWRSDFWEQWLLCFTPIDQCVENLWLPQLRHLPADLRAFAYCVHHHPATWGCDTGTRQELAFQGYSSESLQNLATHVECMRVELETWRQGTMWRSPRPIRDSLQGVTLNERQREACIRAAVQRKLRLDDEASLSQLRGIGIFGSAGTGKSLALLAIARSAYEQGLTVAIVSFTALVADAYRGSCTFAHCSTVHGLLQWRTDFCLAEAAAYMLRFGIVIVDEVYMLPEVVFENFMQTWLLLERRPELLLVGDEGQLQPFDETGRSEASNHRSTYWNLIDRVQLVEPMRADTTLWDVQEYLRFYRPSAAYLRESVVRGNVFHRGPLTAQVLRDLFYMFPHTTLVCVSRKCCSFLNALAQEGILRDRPVLGERLFDEGSTRTKVFVQSGLQSMITQNVNKERRLFNGARCTISEVLPKALRVELDSGPCLLRLIYDRGARYFPIARAYALTLAKMQGMTLGHITIMPDVTGVPAAGYVAYSRVRSVDDVMFLVYPRPGFFTPSER